MKKGGYQIIDLSAYKFTNGESQTIPNVYNIIKNTKKIVLISGLTVDCTEYNDMFTVFIPYETYFYGLTRYGVNNVYFAVTDNSFIVNVEEIRKPIAYLYNGVELPTIPNFDKEKYKYLYIMRWGNVLYNLIMCTSPLYYEHEIVVSGALEYDYLICKSDCEALLYQYDRTNVEHEPPDWFYSDEGSGSFSGNTKVFNTSVLMFPLWANADLYKYVDNTLYLKASEPIPVY